jgi:hypothetical protein
MRVRPPAPKILEAEDPGLADSSVGDRRADLRGAVGIAAIEPVEALAARDVRLQVGPVVDRRPARRGVEMLEPVAPVGERHVVVDADEIDVPVRPERVEVEEHVPASVLRMMPEVFRPVGGVAELRRWPEDRPDIGGEVAERLHGGIARCVRAHRGQAAHLRADQEGVDPARGLAEMGIVQDHAPQPPVTRGAGAAYDLAGDRELARARRAEEGRDLRRGRGGPIDRSRVARRRGAGDPSPPGKGRLAQFGCIVAVRVRQRIARGHVHQEEGIEGDPQLAGLQLADRLDHREVGGRAAVDRPALGVGADQMRVAPLHPVHRPVPRACGLRHDLDTGADPADPRAQVVAEPGRDEAHARDLRRHRLQPVERLDHVGAVGAGVEVLRRRPDARAPADAARRVGELARGRDQRHRLRQPLGGVGIGERAEHLEAQLRQAVAVGAESQILEDHIGRAAIGRRRLRPHPRRDEGIGLLRLVAGMPAPGDAGEVHRLAVGPDPADPGDRASAEGDRERGRVEILRGRGPAPAAALAAALAPPAPALAEVRRPDHGAAHAHAAMDARDDRALGRGGDAQAVEPRPLDALGGRERGDDAAVDDRADRGADEAADGRGGDTEHRAADRAADGGARGAEDEGGHEGKSEG